MCEVLLFSLNGHMTAGVNEPKPDMTNERAPCDITRDLTDLTRLCDC